MVGLFGLMRINETEKPELIMARSSYQDSHGGENRRRIPCAHAQVAR
jgi:hypothetical protein